MTHCNRTLLSSLAAAWLALAVVAGFAAADEFQLLDDSGQPTERVTGTVKDVDLSAGQITINSDKGPLTLSFVQIAPYPDLYNALYAWQKDAAEKATTPEEKRRVALANLTAARLRMTMHTPGDKALLGQVKDRLDAAREFDASLAPQIDAELAVLQELRAMDALHAARQLMDEGRLDRCVQAIQELRESYPGSVAERESAALAQAVHEQREATEAARAAEPDAPAISRQLVQVANVIGQARDKLREGYDMYARARNSACLTPWNKGLEFIESPYDGVLAAITAFEKRQPANWSSEEANRLRARAQEVQIALYKALAHYFLRHTSFTQCDAMLTRAMALDPGDRELIILRLDLDSKWIRTRIAPPTDPDTPEGLTPPDDGTGVNPPPPDDDDDG